MFYRSLFTSTIAFCALLSGGAALADSFTVSNDDSSAYSLINSLGQSLNEGKATLGAFNSDSWSYNMATSEWMFEGQSYNQDQLTYSQLINMQNSFTSTLNPSSIPGEQNGTVTNGSFNLSGQYQSSSSLTSPVYLMVTGETGELAVFVFKSVDNDSVFTYNDVDLSGTNMFEFWLTSRDQARESGLNYYMDCILGNVDSNLETIQLLVPEPATATLGLMGLAALMVRRRRQ